MKRIAVRIINTGTLKYVEDYGLIEFLLDKDGKATHAIGSSWPHL
jgi:hypothetical protein